MKRSYVLFLGLVLFAVTAIVPNTFAGVPAVNGSSFTSTTELWVTFTEALSTGTSDLVASKFKLPTGISSFTIDSGSLVNTSSSTVKLNITWNPIYASTMTEAMKNGIAKILVVEAGAVKSLATSEFNVLAGPLNIAADTKWPTFVSAQHISKNIMRLLFSENVSTASAKDITSNATTLWNDTSLADTMIVSSIVYCTINTTHTVAINGDLDIAQAGVKDFAGNTLPAAVNNADIVDVAGPEIDRALYTSPTNLYLHFTEPIQLLTTQTVSGFTATNGGGWTASSVKFDPNVAALNTDLASLNLTIGGSPAYTTLYTSISVTAGTVWDMNTTSNTVALSNIGVGTDTVKVYLTSAAFTTANTLKLIFSEPVVAFSTRTIASNAGNWYPTDTAVSGIGTNTLLVGVGGAGGNNMVAQGVLAANSAVDDFRAFISSDIRDNAGNGIPSDTTGGSIGKTNPDTAAADNDTWTLIVYDSLKKGGYGYAQVIGMDTTKVTVVSAEFLGNTAISVKFSEALSPTNAVNASTMFVSSDVASSFTVTTAALQVWVTSITVPLSVGMPNVNDAALSWLNGTGVPAGALRSFGGIKDRGELAAAVSDAGSINVGLDVTKPLLTSIAVDYNNTKSLVAINVSEGLSAVDLTKIKIVNLADNTDEKEVLLTGASYSIKPTSVAIIMTEEQRIAAQAISNALDGGVVMLQLQAGALSDKVGNTLAVSTATVNAGPVPVVTETPDTTKPTITSATINLNNGVMVVKFDETVSINQSTGVFISSNGVDTTIALNVSTKTYSPVASTTTYTFTLTEAARVAAIGISSTVVNGGDNGKAAEFMVQAAAIVDLASNQIAYSSKTLVETPDTTAPTMYQAQFFSDKELRVTFNEFISTVPVDGTGFTSPKFTVKGSSVTSDKLVVRLDISGLATADQKNGLSLADGLTIVASKVKDFANNYAIAATTPVLADVTRPEIVTSEFVDNKTIKMTFNKAINSINPFDTLANMFKLTSGAGVVGAQIDASTKTIVWLTIDKLGHQTQFTGDTLRIAANAIRDNASNGIVFTPAQAIAKDTTAPKVSNVTFVSRDKVFVTFNEAIREDYLNMSKLLIQDPSNASYLLPKTSETITSSTETVLTPNTVVLKIVPALTTAKVATSMANAFYFKSGFAQDWGNSAAAGNNSSESTSSITISADTFAPVLYDTTNPNSTGIKLDFNNNRLVLTFYEEIDTGTIVLSNLKLQYVNSGSSVDVAGVDLTDNQYTNAPVAADTNTYYLNASSRTLTFALSETEMGTLRNYYLATSSPLALSLPASAVKDLVGNANVLAVKKVEQTADTTNPYVKSAKFISSLQIDVKFSESLNKLTTSAYTLFGSSAFQVKENGAELDATDPTLLHLFVTGVDDLELEKGLEGGPAAGEGLTITAGAVKDLAGNLLSPTTEFWAVTKVDTLTRTIKAKFAALNYNYGDLTIYMDALIDIGALESTLGQLSIKNAAGTSSISLLGSSITSTLDTDVVQIRLTEAQRQSALLDSNLLSGTSAVLHLNASAMVDTLGNNNIAQDLTIEGETPDTTRPVMNSASIDFGTGLLTITANEKILLSTPTVDLTKVFIGEAGGVANNATNKAVGIRTGGWWTANPLAVSTIPLAFQASQDTIVIQLTAEQKAFALSLSSQPVMGNKTPLFVNIDNNAFMDISFNGIVAGSSQTAEIADTTPPNVIRVDLSLVNGAASVDIETDEEMTIVSTAGLHIANGITATADDVNLVNDQNGLNLRRFYSDKYIYSVSLTEAQRMLAVKISTSVNVSNARVGDGTPANAVIDAGALKDSMGNSNISANLQVLASGKGLLSTVPKPVLDDIVGPNAQNGGINFGSKINYANSSRKLTLVFDETINADPIANVDLARIYISSASAGLVKSMSLAGASVEKIQSSTITITLTPAQIAQALAWSGVIGGDDGAPIGIYMAFGAVRDMSANGSPLQGIVPTEYVDTEPPAMVAGLKAVDNPADDGTKLLVTWTANKETDLDRYVIYYSPNPITDITDVTLPRLRVDGTAVSQVIEGLSVDTLYHIVMTAVDKAGNESVQSAEVTATTRRNIIDTTADATVISNVNANTKITIPAGALVATQGTQASVSIDLPNAVLMTEILNSHDAADNTINRAYSQSLNSTIVDFEVTGIVVGEVTLQIAYPATIPASVEPYLRIFRFNPTTAKWEMQPNCVIDGAANVVKVNVNHLSVYRIFVISAPQDDLSAVAVYPNPFKPNSGDALSGTNKIVFGKLTANAEVKIYTLSGELVKTLEKTVDVGTIEWNPVANENGESVASGLYLYVISGSKADGAKVDTVKGKIAIVK